MSPYREAAELPITTIETELRDVREANEKNSAELAVVNQVNKALCDLIDKQTVRIMDLELALTQVVSVASSPPTVQTIALTALARTR